MTDQTITVPAPATQPAAGTARTFTLELPAGLELLNSNQRLDRWRKAQVTRDLRAAACVTARASLEMRRALEAVHPRGLLERAHILAVIRPGSKRRLDPANLYPTVKACVDGLVDARVLEDDDHVHLEGPDMRRGRVVKGGQLVLIVRELELEQRWPDFGEIQ